MLNIDKYFCVNEHCSHYGLRGKGNIVRCGTYGKFHRQILQCKICKRKFSETRNTALFGTKYSDETVQKIIHCVAEGNGVRNTARILGLSKDAVNRVIKIAGAHCDYVMANLLQSLSMEQCQMDELWSFIQKKKLIQKSETAISKDESVSG